MTNKPDVFEPMSKEFDKIFDNEESEWLLSISCTPCMETEYFSKCERAKDCKVFKKLKQFIQGQMKKAVEEYDKDLVKLLVDEEMKNISIMSKNNKSMNNFDILSCRKQALKKWGID